MEGDGHVELVAKWVRPDYVTGAHFEEDEAVLPNILRPEDLELLEQLKQELR